MSRFTLIAGPTASGKSAFALRLAAREKALIVNADSMQVYKELQILTARPRPKELLQVAHYLYGYVPARQSYSVGMWLRDVKKFLAENHRQKVIFVGGTGLYFEALLGGLSVIPDIDEAVRKKWRRLAENTRSADLYELLKQKDPVSAAKLAINDKMRMTRALEVFEATGRPLSFWQEKKGESLLAGEDIKKFLLMPEAALLRRLIAARFEQMLKEGAIEEVEKLLELQLSPNIAAMKVIGVKEIANYLRGEVDLQQATTLAITRTCQYAKRQRTWFRQRFTKDWQAVNMAPLL